jgi:hypothetical protein
MWKIATPALGTYGNLGVCSLTGPSFWELDTPLSRIFRIGEHQSLEARWKAFNVTNSMRPLVTHFAREQAGTNRRRLKRKGARKDTRLSRQQEHPGAFAARFSRCHPLLHFIACHVLGGPERAEDVIEGCRRTESRNSPRFEHEGAFRSWLLRVLIDEALAIRCQAPRHQATDGASISYRTEQPAPVRRRRSRPAALGPHSFGA